MFTVVMTFAGKKLTVEPFWNPQKEFQFAYSTIQHMLT